jgi:hypothetical protein
MDWSPMRKISIANPADFHTVMMTIEVNAVLVCERSAGGPPSVARSRMRGNAPTSGLSSQIQRKHADAIPTTTGRKNAVLKIPTPARPPETSTASPKPTAIVTAVVRTVNAEVKRNALRTVVSLRRRS